MSNEVAPPPPTIAASNPPFAQPPKKSHLLLKVLGAIVGLFILHGLFSSKSTPSGSAANTSVASADGDPLVGSWTVVPPGDPSCDDQAVFSHNSQGLRLYSGVSKGVRSSTTGYTIQGNTVVIGVQNQYGFNQFTIASPTSISKTWCSSMACSTCAYTKD